MVCWRLMLLVCVLGLGPVALQAETYYVSQAPGASNSNSCSTASASGGCTGGSCARRNVRNGASCLSGPGDVLKINSGTYSGEGTALLPEVNGGPGNPIIIESMAGLGSVTLLGGPGDEDFVTITGRSYYVIRGLIFEGNGAANFAVSTSSTGPQASHITFEDNEFANTVLSCIQPYGQDINLLRNHIHHCGTTVDYDHGVYYSVWNGLVQHNHMHHNKAYNIQSYKEFDTPSFNHISYNRFGNSPLGIITAWGTGHSVNNNMSYNDNGIIMSATNSTYAHNSLWCGKMESIGPDSGSVVANNVLYCPSGGVSISTDTATESNNMLDINPGWMDPATGDLHVPAGSPVLNNCPVFSGGSPDYDGDSRPQDGNNYDCGADERVPTVTLVPTSLAFAQQPLTQIEGLPLSPPVAVEVQDQFGARYTATTATISLALGANPGSATLGGTTSQAASAGLASFPTLSVSNDAAGYTLVASAPSLGLSPVTSNAFTITAMPAAPAAPSTLRILADTVTIAGTLRLGWDYPSADPAATGFTVERQAACTGAWTARPQMPMPMAFSWGIMQPLGMWSTPRPGTYGTTYYYAPDATIDPAYTGHTYFEGKGMKMVRVTVSWENIQRTLGGGLDATDLARLQSNVNAYTGRGVRVLLQIYNEARYQISGTDHVLGGGTVTNAHLASLWSQLANTFKSNPLVEFGVMALPRDLPTETWVSGANAATAAIRGTGATNRIHISGGGLSKAKDWAQTWYGTANSVALLNYTDSGNNSVYQVQTYLDSADEFYNTSCVSATIGPERLAEMTAWLRTHNKKGFLGEGGAAQAAPCPTALGNLAAYLRANSDVWVGWTAWVGSPSGGPWFPAGDVMLLDPAAGPTDKPQMDVLEPYLAEQGSVAQSYTDTSLSISNTYCWRVVAVDAYGQRSPVSNTVQWPAAPIPPATDLTITTYTTGNFLAQ